MYTHSLDSNTIDQKKIKLRKALIVEDDSRIAELVALHLEDLQFETEMAYNGQEGLNFALQRDYDLIILDIMLPLLNGIDLCKIIRSKDIDCPIIMLTARSEEIDKVLGLETGADDYMTKPFSIRELQARVKAIMRRTNQIPDRIDKGHTLQAGDITLDFDKRTLERNSQRIDLTPKEFDLLSLLASKPGKSFNRKELLNLVWGYDFVGFEHTVNSHINRLRAKIEPDMTKPQYILTTWGYGYRFNENV